MAKQIQTVKIDEKQFIRLFAQGTEEVILPAVTNIVKAEIKSATKPILERLDNLENDVEKIDRKLNVMIDPLDRHGERIGKLEKQMGVVAAKLGIKFNYL